MKKEHSSYALLLVCSAFFISGACGLAYEVLWTRFLAGLIGASALAQTVVLMVFMGGLSLGAFVYGRLVDQGVNGLRCYGYLEIVIGLYGICYPFLFGFVEKLYLVTTASFPPGSPSLFLLKISSSVLLIGLPSVQMGGTLPVLTRYLTTSNKLLRRNVSLLYGLNSMGAVLGALFAGFYLVHRFGMQAGMMYTGAVSFLLGVVSLTAASWIDRLGIDFSADRGMPRRRWEERLDLRVYDGVAVRRAVIAAAVSGFGAMALQMAWIRYFIIVIGATHSAFTIVIAAFIFGIGIGSLLAGGRFAGRFPLTTVLTATFALTTITLGAGLYFYGRAPFEIGKVLSIFARTAYAWPAYEAMKFAVCFFLMLLPCLASGMILPVCVRIAGRGDQRVGRDVALIYIVNTLGALLGIWITGQVFFRFLSLPETLRVIFFIYVLTAFFLAFLLRENGRKRIITLLALLVIGHLVFWAPWPPHHLFVDRVRFQQNPPPVYEDFVRNQQSAVLVDDRQGPDVAVTVLDDTNDANPYRTMYINGKPDASDDFTGPDVITEILLAQLPLLLHPEPHEVFILGVGGGISSGEALKFPLIGSVVTAELAAEVFEASKHFAASNGRYWEHPAHRIVIEDGKTYLQHSKEVFDVIAMEPTNIWQEGMAGLFSEDFFRLAKERLAPDGVLAQWFHTYSVDNLTLATVLKTFSRVFPKSSIFNVNKGDLLLIGYGDEWQFDPISLEHNFYRPQTRESMKRIGLDSPAALLMFEVVNRERFDDFARSLQAPVNTDDLPVLEYYAEYGHFLGRGATLLNREDSRLIPGNRNALVQKYFDRLGFDAPQTRKLIEAVSVRDNERIRNSLVLQLMEKEKVFSGDSGKLQELLPLLQDRELAGAVTDPNYNANPFLLGPNEAYALINNELLVWAKASSSFWSPDIRRLRGLYDRLAPPADPERAGQLALVIAGPLAKMGACAAALPFYRLAEDNGVMNSGYLGLNDILWTFYCEAREGDPQRAMDWWREIEQLSGKISEEVLMDKAALDNRLAAEPGE